MRLGCIAILGFYAQIGLASASQSVIFNSTENAITAGPSPSKSCLNSALTSAVVPDILRIAVDPWRGGGLVFGCQEKDASWRCTKSCYYESIFGDTPDFSKYQYLTFNAKVSGQNGLCQPKLKLVKRYPAYNSKTIALSGKYVDQGALSGSEFRQVVIPMNDLSSTELCGGALCWPALKDVANMYFLTCGAGFPNLVYDIRNIMLTDEPPSMDTASPTSNPTPPPPTEQPTPKPTSSPTPLPDAKIFVKTTDAFTLGQTPAVSCLATPGGNVNTKVSSAEADAIQIAPDHWHAAGLNFGCREKDASYACIKSCYYQGQFGDMPNFSKYQYLTFKAKVSAHDKDCSLAIRLSHSWPVYYSKEARLSGSYVDAGELVASEWRNVVIPTKDLISDELCNGLPCWPELSSAATLWFNSCSSEVIEYPLQPVYQISDITLTNYPPKLLSQPPTMSPTPYITVSPSLATHRMVDCSDMHHHWYPIFEPDREPSENVWLVASNNEWPDVGPTSEHTVTVLVPAGQIVTYHSFDSIKYDKVIVKGVLNIKPLDGDVKLTVGTLVVEQGGILNIATDSLKPYTVTIEIDGSLDREIDPQETTVGLICLSGSVNVYGKPVPVKSSELSTIAQAGDVSVVLEGVDAANHWVVGDQILFPDTKAGRNVLHWNFPNNEGGYVDQTELRTIATITTNGDGNTVVGFYAPLNFQHAGCNIAHVTRSITFITSPTSVHRGHIMHTGGGSFSFKHARIENFGRTTTKLINDTVVEEDDLDFEMGLARLNVVRRGSNQKARYALHAHHAMVEVFFEGNAILFSPRNGIVAHNSRVHIVDNVVVGANGSAIFIEDGTETGPVMNNFLVGTGGGSRGGDDGRFASQNGTDMGHGGFGIWSRGGYCHIENNRAEGSFGLAPFSFFTHSNFVLDKPVPNVTGTPEFLIGKSSKQIGHELDHDLTLQTFGSFINNTARGTWKNGLDLSYMGAPKYNPKGHLFDNVNLIALAQSGNGVLTIHSKLFTMKGGSISGAYAGNTITGVFCNSCDNCMLDWNEEDGAVIFDVAVVRGGNC